MSYKSDLEDQKKQIEAKLYAAGTTRAKAKLTDRIAKIQQEIDACPTEKAPKAAKAKKSKKR